MMSRASPSAIAQALGGEVRGGQILAPGPGHSSKDRSLSVRLSSTAADGFVVHSYAGDDVAACRDHVRERVGISRRSTRPRSGPVSSPISTSCRNADSARRAAFVAAQITAITRELVPLRGTPGQRYLREIRHIDSDPIADVLDRIDAVGWHPAVFFREEGHSLNGQRLGCIIAIMTDPITAAPTGSITRTYIDADLKKLGKARALGTPMGIVRLASDEDVPGGLYLAEGLETALSAMSIGLRPLWATGSTSILNAFPLLCGIETLSILADHDANGAGEKAARELELRWRCGAREVHIFQSDQTGDFNDVLRRDVQ
jgi:putative DNA primase/helicase